MKLRRLAACCAICVMLFILLPFYTANCQNYVEYSIQLNADGSALWKITNFSDVNAPVDTWEGFQNKVSNLVNSAANETQRNMAVDENSLQINTTVSFESKTTEYSFSWENFSIIQGNQIVVGDVFQVNNFFSQLYGDAEVLISYPSTYSVKSVTPSPNQRDDSAKTIEWARTQNIVDIKTNIILTSATSDKNTDQNGWQQYTLIVAVIAVGVTLSLVGFYYFKQRKTLPATRNITLTESTEMETEDGKILKLLKSSSGSMRQSDIGEQCRFSKAKTSQLLSLLEKRGDITRYKKGRDKIVNLTERVKSEVK